MKAPRLVPVLLAGATALTGLALGLSTSASAETHPLCRAAGAIPAHALAKGVRTAECDLTGRLVQAGPVAARVPRSGLTVMAEAYAPAGVEEAPILRVTHQDGVVTASEELAAEDDGAHADERIADSGRIASGCRQNTAPNPWDIKWKNVYNWYFQMGTTPARYSKLVVEHHIKTAAGNVAAGNNDCGLTGDPQLTQVYRGRTSVSPNISPAGDGVACSNTPDQRNVVGFKNIPSYLGYACAWSYASDPSRIYSADIVIDSDNRAIVPRLPADCTTNLYEMQGMLTHEFAHTAGFGHANNQTYTMNPSQYPCDYYARTFTRNEWYGLKQKYGVR